MSIYYERLIANSKRADNGCLEWQGATDGRYGLIQLPKKLVRTHRLMWEQHNGPIPKGMFVCHKCDNPKCMEITHLFLGTPQDNSDDMVAKGRVAHNTGPRPAIQGSRHHKAKLSEEAIEAIRNDKRVQWKIAEDYGVSRSTISHVKNGHNWNHV